MGRRRFEQKDDLEERVVHISRVAKVVKGGRRFGFRTVVVVGDGQGKIGIGVGRARTVPASIRKGADRARRDMHQIVLWETTIPHEIEAKFAGARVLLRPATPGTGVIAGGAVRAVVEVAGIKNVLTKSLGSANILNVALATIEALNQLTDPKKLAELRGLEVSEVAPFWYRAGN